MVSAIASVVSALAAWFGIGRGTKEMARWREQQRTVKHAEVAGETLVATIRFLDGLVAVTSLMIAGAPEGTDPNDEHAVARAVAQERWTSLASVSNEFTRAWAHAETCLPEPVSEFLKRVWELRSEIWAGQATFFAVPLGKGTQFFDRGWGSGPDKKIEALQAEARTVLRHLAQMTDTKSNQAEAVKQLADPKQRKLPSAK